MLEYKDTAVQQIKIALTPPPPKPPVDPPKPPVKKVYKSYYRAVIFPEQKLETPEDIDAYADKIREHLKQLLKNCDGIHLK